MKQGRRKQIKHRLFPERKHARKTLQEMDSFSDTLISLMKDGLYVVDPDGVIIDVNPAFCEMTGFSRAELLGVGMPHPFCPPEEFKEIERTFQKIKRGEFREFELTFMRKSGERFPVLVSPACIKDAQGNVVNYFATIKDITELKRLESRLRTNEERYRLLVENQTDLIVKVDIEGRLLFVSKTYCETFGKSEEELLGRNFIPFIHQDDRKATAEAMSTLYRPPYSCYVEHRAMTQEGWRWFGWAYKAVLDEEKNVVAIVGIGRDISARKRTEEELLTTNQTLSTLLSVSRAIVSSRTPEEFSDSLVRVLRGVLRMDAFYLDAYIPGTDELYGLGNFDTIDGQFRRVSQVDVKFELGKGPSTKIVFEKKKPILIHRKPSDLTDKTVSTYSPGSFVPFGDKSRPSASLVFVPLIVGERVIGVMSVQSYTFNAYTQRDVELLSAVGRQIAPAVENLLLTHQLIKKTAELRESEERFKQVAENAQEWIWEIDTQGVYTYSSPMVEKILGYKPEEVVGKMHFYDFFHPDDREKLKKFVFDSFQKKQSFHNFLNRNIHKDGSTVWLTTSGVPILDKDGNLLGYRGADTDITERKRAEEELKQAHYIYRSAIENAQGLPYLLKYTDYMYEFMGEGCKELLGIPSSELTFEKMREITKEMIVTEPDAPSDPFEYGRMFRLGKVKRYRMDLRIITPSGEEKWLTDCSVPVRDERTGKVIGSLGILQDITDRKRTEEELRKSRDELQKLQMQYQAILRSTPHGLCMLSPDWKIMYANRSMRIILDPECTSTADVIGLSLRGLFASKEEYEEYIHSATESVRRTGIDMRELHLQRVDGTRFWCMLSVVCVDPTDVEAGYVASLSDITELKRAEERSKAFAELGQRLNGAKSQKEAAKVIVDTAEHLLGWDACFVSHYIPEVHAVYSVLNIDTIDGKKIEFPPVLSGKFPSKIEERTVIEGGQLILRDTTDVESNLIPFGNTSRRSASLMFVPIRKGKKVVGILSIQSYTPYAYTEDDLKTLQLLADHCGGALERIQAEESLRESEMMYRTLFEEALNPIFIVDEKGRFIDANNSALDFLEHRRDELPTRKLWELLPETVLNQENHKGSLSLARRTIETEYSVHGKSKTLLLNVVPLTVSGKRIFYGIGQDITDRKRAEEALRGAARQWRTTFDAISDSVCLMTPEGRILRCNKATAELLRKPFSEIVGRTHYELIHKTFSPPQDCIVQRVRKTLRRETTVLQLEDRWFEASIDPLLDESGNLMGGVYILTDITERKRAEEALRVAAREWRTTFDAISDSVCLMSPKGRILRCNKATAELLRKPFSEIVGHTHYELIHKTSSPPQDCIVQRVRKTLRRETTVLQLEDRWFEASIDPLLDESGNLMGGVYILTDVTERLKALEELEKSHKEMRALARHLDSVREEERTQIAREIHDELGQTLTALKMDVYWLANRLPKHHTSLIKKTETMLKLIDMTIQTVKRISTELRPGLLDDLGLATAIVWQAEEFQKRTGTKCEVQLSPEDIVVDKARATVIFRIFQETLTNVARHSQASRVSVSLRQKHNKLVLTVKDNGIGINKKQIYDPHSFGLIGMRERCYSIGGTLSITGRHNKGTTVIVTIPLNLGGTK
ncbi:PAS domain S-box protein [Candidatus Sumerlaeota bacterium]|nr:PAS domain S-box protein [Candidatus Sumerlaeota bacterium]